MITIGYRNHTNFCEHLRYANIEQERLEDLLWIKEADARLNKQAWPWQRGGHQRNMGKRQCTVISNEVQTTFLAWTTWGNHLNVCSYMGRWFLLRFLLVHPRFLGCNIEHLFWMNLKGPVRMRISVMILCGKINHFGVVSGLSLVHVPISPTIFPFALPKLVAAWRWKVYNHYPHKHVTVHAMQWHNCTAVSSLGSSCKKVFPMVLEQRRYLLWPWWKCMDKCLGQARCK